MRNLDILQAKKVEILQKMRDAITNNDEGAFSQAFIDFSENIQQAVMEEAMGLVQAADNTILVGRGVRQLTSAETKYYQAVIDAMKSSNPRQALTEVTNVLPITTIEAVFEDLAAQHPLLQSINFQNTSGLIEYLVNTNGKELGVWGTLTADIVKELTSGFKKVNMTLNKLSAFLPIAKSMLDLGPAWLDRYTRAILFEAAAYGLEGGITVGTGKDMPIGMNRQVGEGVTVTDGVYPVKNAIVVNSLDPITYGSLLSQIATDPSGKSRVIDKVILICNPVDYLLRIMPATTIRSADGRYVNNVLPYPTEVVQSTEVPAGRAILGLAKKYFMAMGTAKEGKIEYSDEYKFLEDERVYLIKLYGHGEPLDNNAFLYLDISGLQPAAHQVFVTNTEGDPLPIYPIYDARLTSLTIGSLTLSPSFNKSVFVYTADTTNATNTITAIPKDGEATIEITNGATPVVNGAAATWATGENIVTIEVTSGTETETYTVIVTKTA
jgi:HK97 family phage major capsid protein